MLRKNHIAQNGKWHAITLVCLLLIKLVGTAAADAETTLEAFVVANNATERTAFSEGFRMFEKANPGVVVKETFTDAGSFPTKLIAMTVGGVQPDIMWLWGIHFRSLAPKGYLMPLDNYVDKNFLSAYFPNGIETSRYKGELFALPGLVGTLAIMANLDMFANAGVQLPTYNDNWETFLTKTKKLTRAGEQPQYGFTWYAKTVRDWTTWIWRAGGDLFNSSLTSFTLNSPQSMEALQYLSDLTNVYKVTPPGNTLVGSPSSDFYNQKAAMYPNGSWSLNALETVKFNIDIVSYPANKNQISTMDTFFMAVHSQAKHPQQAVALAKWFTSTPEGQGQLYATKFGIPATRRDAIKYFIQTKHPWHLDVFLNSLNVDQARALPYVENWSDIEAMLVKEFTPVWKGEKAVQTVVDELTPRVNALLK